MKHLAQVFEDIEIPESLSDAEIFKIQVDTCSRKICLGILLGSCVGCFDIWQFAETVRKQYEASGISMDVKIKDFLPSTETISAIKPIIIKKITEESSVGGVVLSDAVWEYRDGKLVVLFKHGGKDIVESERLEMRIGRIFEQITDKKTEVVAEYDYEEIKMVLPKVAVPIKKEEKKEKVEAGLVFGRPVKAELVPIADIDEGTGKCAVLGDVFAFDSRTLRNGKMLITFGITDKRGSVSCKIFTAGDEQKNANLIGFLSSAPHVKIEGKAGFDTYTNALNIEVSGIEKVEEEKKTDTAEQRRVELHLHTQMSDRDGVGSVKECVKRAVDYGHKAVAITDHGCVHAFPEAYKTRKELKSDIKIIYGVEAYFVNDCDNLIYSGNGYSIDDELVIFDIETTGLSAKSDRITEIGAVKIRGNEILGRFSTFVRPGIPIPERITALTGITDEMVEDTPSQYDAVSEFVRFCGDAPVMAHNASFDVGFIKEECKRDGIRFTPAVLDTLSLSRALFKERKKHKLDILAEFFGIKNSEHHRAVNDAEVLSGIWQKFSEILKGRGIFDLSQIDRMTTDASSYRTLPAYHAIILVKNLTGLRNLYSLISDSNLKYFYKKPRILKSEYIARAEGLVIGSACEAGELYRAVASGNEDKTDALCKFYDYFEVQPLGNNRFMVENGEATEEDLKEYNKKIIELGRKYGKPVVATGDVHFLNPEDEIYRRIAMHSRGFKDADNQAPLYFRTTAEMLAEFDYLDKDTAEEIVVKNTGLLADMIEDIRPVPEDKCPPEIKGSEEELQRLCREKAEKIYGKPLPQLVQDRMDKELKSIVSNGFAVMYIIAHKLVKKSNNDGYMVGSRGSVGSSLVAFLANITEVNALPPHYVCGGCKHSEFIMDGSVKIGIDMEDKVCPECGEMMQKDGFNIPFETFLGFDGTKDPDIDLNFSGDYQTIAHKYVEELFGTGQVFRAGTILEVAEKTALGYVRSYFADHGMTVSEMEIKRIAEGCTGMRRSTGQHPGGIIVVPKGHDIEEFTPVQHPADKSEIDIITTHFDYHSIEKNLLKLDILGHDDPTMIKMLEELTGVDAKTIPLDDEETMSLFLSTDALGLKEKIKSKVGTYAVPEFGTNFTQQILLETKPTTMAELVNISGLSHGTNVWTDNAQTLIRNGICGLSECICTRDEIMVYLMFMKLEPSLAFKIMESVRRGRGLTPEFEQEMRAHNVPSWYIDSCKKIKYMFPKAHAVAYVTMALRIAWFKVHYPVEFYMAFFSIRAKDFDFDIMARGRETLERNIKSLEQKGKDVSTKEKNTLSILYLCDEMYKRGIEFCGIDLYESDAVRFKLKDGKILPPLNSLSGLGDVAAIKIVDTRNRPFLSKDEFITRTGATKTVMEALEDAGCLTGMPESRQVTFL